MGIYVFEAGKIATSLLGALALAAALTGVSNRIFGQGEFAKAGYVVATAHDAPVAQASAGAAAVEKPAPASVSESRSADAGSPELIAPDQSLTRDEKRADAETGACQACDAAEKSAVAKAGPPLFALVDRQKNSVAGLAHSGSIRAEAASWSLDDLDKFLARPGGYAPGETDAKAADIVEYLRRLPDYPRHGRGK
jgi:cytochrome c